jgi:GNAT superfamily N-acetyltransferase
MSKMSKVTIYYLEMLDQAALRASTRSHPDATITRAEIPNPEFNRFLYSAVGGEWHWHERLSWNYSRWMQWLDRPQQETWVAYVRGTPAGYVELELQPTGNVEIAYFGLLPHFIGHGLGGQLLTFGIQRGWDMGANRVWVHTCSLDHPSALRNYQARGLRVYNEEEKWVLLPDATPGPWPNAQRSPFIFQSSQE